MKKFFSLFAITLCILLSSMIANGAVIVNPGGGSYPTLKDAFDAINAGTHTGTVTIDIQTSTVEPVKAVLNASGVGLANYTSVVITTSTGGVIVSGSDTSAVIKLAGADNVTIDGRIGGTGRNISVINSSTTSNSCAIWISHGGVSGDSLGAKRNIIRNLEIACGVNQSTSTTSTFGIIASGHNRTIVGRHNDSNEYRENRIIRCRIGINLLGGTAGSRSFDNIIEGNIVGPSSFGADEIGITGINTTFQDRCMITKNQVQFVGGTFALTTGGADRVGIGLGANTWSSTSTTTTTGGNNTISENIIHDIVDERTFSAVGIVIGQTRSGPATNNLIVNNVIYNIRCNGTTPDQGAGIGHSGGPADKIIFNSISLTGDIDPAGTTSAGTNPVAGGICKHSASAADTAIFIKNNSIYVDLSSNTTTLIKSAIIAPAVGYNFGSFATAGGLDFNDYWIPNPGVDGHVTGVAGTGTSSFTTLAAWQAVYTPGQDAASIQCDPMYVNISSDLRPSIGSCLLLAGTPITGITTDILNVTRNATNPTIGAYEQAVAPPTDVGCTNALIGNLGQIISVGKGYDIVATVKNFGPVVTVVPVYYTDNGGSPVGPVNTVGPIPTNGTENVTFSGGFAYSPLTAGVHTLKVYTALAADLNYVNDTFTVVINVQQKINTYPYVQTFGTPTNWTILFENPVGTTALWQLGLCTNVNGTANDTAATSNCFNGSAGRVEVLRSPEMDFTGMTNPVLNFYCAYRSFSGESDSMQVVVSTDGGVTFSLATTVYDKGYLSTPSLATLPPNSSSYFPAAAGEWRHESVSLAGVAGNSNVVIGFRSISDFGNRQWVDNVIVSDVNAGICTDNVTAIGTYNCNSQVFLNFTAIPAPPPYVSSGERSEIINKTSSEQNIIGSFNSFTSNIRKVTNHTVNTDNPAGGVAMVNEYDNIDPGQNIAINTTATNGNSMIVTPSVAYHDFWFNVTYTGNDYLGFATYNIKIDLNGSVFPDLGDLYIMKRTDRTGPWVCLNTTVNGNALETFGLTTFSDFAIGGPLPLPVELSSFVSVVNRRDVTLNWTTATETNNSGFDVERYSNGVWTKVANIAGNGTSTIQHSYSFTDRNLASGKYNYRLKQIDFNGNFEYHNLSNEVIVGVPVKYDLSQNYPNPFNPTTTINFDLPFDSKVSIKLFDMSGREVSTLVNEAKTAGYYTINFNASNLASGVYFYRITAEGNGNNFTATKKMMLVK